MAERVQIVLEAQDLTSGVLRGIVSQFGELGGAFSDITDAVSKYNGFMDLVDQANKGAAVSADELEASYAEAGVAMARMGETLAVLVVKSLQDAIKETVEYAGEVRQLSLVSGQSAEDTSRMVQVFDDFGVSASELTPLIKAMTKEGLAPNIETLAQLSDQYNAIQDPIQKNEFLFKNFGRAGAELAEIMSKGGASIREMSDSVDESLILTQKAIDDARKYEIALDNWNDSVDGAKTSLVTGLLPALSDTINFFNRGYNAAKIFYGSIFDGEEGFVSYTGALQQATDEQNATTEAMLATGEASDTAAIGIETESEKTARLAEETRLAAEALQEMTDKNNDLLSLTMSLSEENASYNEKLAEMTAKYGEASEEVTALKDAHSAALAQIATDLMIAKMQADGFTDAEYNMAIAMLESTGQIDGAAAQTALAMDKIATAANNAGEGGAVKFGEIMKTVMADGVISNEELQAAMDKFNTEIPKEEISGFNEEIGVAKDEGVANMDELQASADSFSTDAAVAEVQQLIDAINAIPDIPQTTAPANLTGTNTRGVASATGGAGSTIQNIYISSATFVGDGGQWAQI